MTEKKQAVRNYLFSERGKSNLITVSKMLALLEDYKGGERSGAKKFLLVFLDSIQSELELAYDRSNEEEFKRASGFLDNARKYIDPDDFEQASLEIGKAVTECTTPAQNSWQILAENELV